MISDPYFPVQVWDGTTVNNLSRLNDKSPDYFAADQYVAEIIAMESYILDNMAFLAEPGDPNSLVTVKQSGVGHEYKTLVGGTGVTIEITDTEITLIADAVAAVTDHGSLTGLSDDDHTQYILVSGSRAFTGDVSMGTNAITNLADPTNDQDAATKAYVDANGGGGGGVTDHGDLTGLVDDDHTQYVLADGTRAFSGSINAGTNKIINVVDPTVNQDAATKAYVDSEISGLSIITDHGSLTGLSDDDHTQYVLADGTRAFTGNVSLGNNRITGVTDPANPQDAATKAYVDANSETDHGSLSGLADDDHTQYVLVNGGRAFTSHVSLGTNRITNLADPINDQDAATKAWVVANAGVADHGGLTGLGDDDHTQYLLANGTRSLSGNLGAGSNRITGLADPANPQDAATRAYVLANATTDHGALTGLADDDHTQYLLADGTRALSANWSAGSNRITNLADPTNAQDAATRAYVLANIGGGIRENLLTNPQFLISQQWASRSVLGSGEYALDSYKFGNTTSAVFSSAKSSDAPPPTGRTVNSSNSLVLTCTTADTTIISTDVLHIFNPVEGYDAARLHQVPFVLSFWHKHTKTGTHCVCFSNTALDRNYVAEYTQTVSDTWEKATIFVPASPATSTWNQGNGVGLYVIWSLASGSATETTAGSWQSGSQLFTTSNQVNNADSVSNSFRLSDVCLYEGDVDLGFTAPSYQAQLSKCKRYYEKSYDIGTYPGTITTNNSAFFIMRDSYLPYNGTQFFEVEKRASPSVFLYNTQNGTSGQYSRYTTGDVWVANVAGLTFSLGTKSFVLNGFNNAVAEDLVKFHWEAVSRP